MKKAVPVSSTGKARPKRNAKAAAKAAPPSLIAPFPIVGVGASAGGLEAFQELLKHLPVDTGMGFVLVQHLDPDHESALTQLLARSTAMPVIEVTNHLRVEANHVYVIPPNTCMSIADGMLKLTPRTKDRGPTRSIDYFFEALAQDQRGRAIGVVLSGTATDGTLGLEMIKAEGGVTFAQDASAKYDSMPRSAVAAGCVDLELSPRKIAVELARIAKHPYVLNAPGEGGPELHAEAEREADQRQGPGVALAPGGHGTPKTGSRRAKAEAAEAGPHDPVEDGFKKILVLLHDHCGVDFSLYKSSTIQRRVTRRLVLNRQETLVDYAAFLKGNSKELDALYSDVLISVTSFFRNPEAFDVLKDKVFPKILAQRERDNPVRIWVLGCSTGQEAYSLAMTFAEATTDALRVPTLQIFATDLNDALLNKARAGLYAKSLEQDVSPERLRRFFVEEEGGYRVTKSLREQVVFARQNEMSDPPFSRMDLITCRNLLIYLEPELQKKIMPAFHYALKPGGFLFLGASESIGQFTELFAPADKKQKIFSKKAGPTPAFRMAPAGGRSTHPSPGQRTSAIPVRGQVPAEGLSGEFNAQREADRISVSQFAPPGVLINAEGQVLQFRGTTSAYLEPPTGKASFDLLKMAREGLMLPLRAAIAKARRENKIVRREGVRLRDHDGMRSVALQVIPLRNLKERCFLILFEEAGAAPGGRKLHLAPLPPPAGKREAAGRIAELEHELAETRDFLQSIQEQNDAANEELQASSEELQSANEELQSLNEELQTSKEELESTNEELTTINDEMGSRNLELSRLNADLNNLQFGIHTAILLLARDLTIRRFTAPAEKIFNLMAGDVGRGFGGVRHNLDVSGLERRLADVIDNVAVLDLEVRDTDGRWYALCARPYLTLDKKIDGVVLVLTDIDALKRSELEIRAARDYAEATLRTAPVPFLVLRSDLRVNSASEAFYLAFKVAPAATEGRLVYEIGNGQWNIPKLRELLEEIIPQKKVFNGFEVVHEFTSIGKRTMLLNARRVDNEEGMPDRILLAIEDITERRNGEDAVRQSELEIRAARDYAEATLRTAPVPVLVLRSDLRVNTASEAFYTAFKVAPSETEGRLIYEIGNGQWNIPKLRELLEEIIPQKNVFNGFEVVHKFAGIGTRTMLLNARRVDNEEGVPDRILLAIEDITDRKHAEEALRAAMAEIQRTSSAKDDFLAALSHELRTPLTPVLMTAIALEGDMTLPAEVREQLSMMCLNIELEARLIDDLLDLTRITRGKLQIAAVAADLNNMLKHTGQIVRSDGLGKKVRIVFQLAATRHYVMADPTRMQQVFWNLLKNAIKFTPTGGTVTVSTRNEDDRSVTISVEDTGVGISEEALPHIFNAFEQGDMAGQHRYGGLGLGLAISKAIIAVHGGKIVVESEGPGRGATFTVTLTTVDAPDALANPKPPLTVSSRGLRLLIVEDHEATRTVLDRLLTRYGHKVTTASSMGAALAAFAADPFDVVVSDLGLPDGSGLELMRELRRQGPVAGIALSGYGMEEDLRQTKEAGFFAHLVKPVKLDQLRLLLDQLPARL